MKTIAVIAQKGGVGKSTLATHLAVEFALAGKVVVALDADPQGSMLSWSQIRTAEQPTVVGASFGELLKFRQAAEADGVDVLLVDTPPHAGVGIEAVTRISDLVLVPVRPGLFDVAALDGTARLVGDRSALVVLNQVPAVGTESSDVRSMLHREFPSLRIAQSQLGLRKAYATALIGGLSVTELERSSAKAASEFRSVFEEVMEVLYG